MTLKAHWTSKRNQTVPVSELKDPTILLDSDNGQIFFTYEIGVVENIPLYKLLDLTCADGIIAVKEDTITQSIKQEDAQNIASTVAKATTDSSSWTLADTWNESTSVSSEYAEEHQMTQEEAETVAKTTSNTYNLTNTNSQSVNVSTSSKTSASLGLKNSNSTSFEHEEAHTETKGSEYHVGAQLNLGKEKSTTDSGELGGNAGASSEKDGTTTSVGIVGKIGQAITKKLNIGLQLDASATWTNETTDSRKDTISGTNTDEMNWNQSLEESTGTSSTQSWNRSESYGQSNSVSKSSSISKALTDTIASTYGYGKNVAQGGSKSEGFEHEDSQSKSDSYSSTVVYSSLKETTKTTRYETNGQKDGYYRLVLAGKAHVFAVVGYDVATGSYFTNTFSVMDDETYEWIDYSATTPSFNDEENGVLPFAVPYEVKEAVDALTYGSTGLQIDIDSGLVTGYTGKDTIVFIPDFISKNRGDGTPVSVKVKGIAPNVFRNNTTLKHISLSNYITEIPNNAFEGCTALEDIWGYHVTSIGANAFAGCTSLNTFEVSQSITKLGTEAFKNVEKITVNVTDQKNADNKLLCTDIINNSILSGAKAISLDVSSVAQDIGGMMLDIPETTQSFEIKGGGKTFENLKIISRAKQTALNYMTVSQKKGVPLEVYSDKLTLSRVNIDSSGYVALLHGKETAISLYGNSKLQSAGGNAVVCQSLDLSSSDSSVASKLNVSGNIYYWGTLAENGLLNLSNGHSIEISSEEEFNQLIKGCYTLSFDANGGTCTAEARSVSIGTGIGELPTATREYYHFEGWYTKLDGGEQVIADTQFSSGEDVILYAHWTPCHFTVTFDANEGNTSEETRKLAYLEELGTLPDASRDYYYFDGWFTERDGGTRLDANYVFDKADNVTLYAHWTQKEVSGWVHESEQPANSQCVEEKWNYWETFYTENTATWLDGWERYDAYWIKSGEGSFYYADFPSGFDTGNWYYQNYEKGPAGAYENETNKRDVQTWRDGWIYWHWMYDCGGANGHSQRAILPWKGTGSASKFYYKYFYAFDSTTDYSYGGTSYTENTGTPNWIASDRTANSQCGGSTRWFRFDRNGCAYQDYYRMFKYRRSENKDSGSYPSGSNISSVNRYVRYRMK